MSDARQRTIIKVRLSTSIQPLHLLMTSRVALQVFRKFSNSLGPEALQVIEGILEQHDIEDADIERSLETLAKEYNKQDGESSAPNIRICSHSEVHAYRRDNESLSWCSAESLWSPSRSRRTNSDRKGVDWSRKSPLFHRRFWNASMDMVAWTRYIWKVHHMYHACHPIQNCWYQIGRNSAPLTSSGSPESRVTSIRDRLNIIRQCVLRNEHFAPSTLPSRDREKLVTVSSLFGFCLLPLILRELAEIY